MAKGKKSKSGASQHGKATVPNATVAQSTSASPASKVVVDEVLPQPPVSAAESVAPPSVAPKAAEVEPQPVESEVDLASTVANTDAVTPTDAAAPADAVTGADVTAEAKDAEGTKEEVPAGQDLNGDDLPLYPVPVKGPGGEEIELQVNPGDTVMDLRQFLADAPETCFYTCYDLILTTKAGIRYHLVDFIEIGEVTDVAGGGCSLEMYAAFYDDRAVRYHVRKTRDLISTAGTYTSVSTTLAAEFEASQRESEDGKPKEADARELPAELEDLGFMDKTAGLLPWLAPKPSADTGGCMESIAFSTFNPVPGHRRLQGDLIYYDLVTVEGKSFPVTAHTRGFMVNSSEGNVLDPRPAEPKLEATTLVGLLRLVSPKFNEAFAAVIERKASGHPFENMVALVPPNPWLGPHPMPPHERQVARSEDALISPYGTETSGILRDWNEELQSCRELPRGTPQERILRGRALYRVTCDFVEAAAKGAKAVIGRSIPPINPPDPDRYHMYVHNNIFFSFAVDGDFVMLQQIREAELAQQAAEAAKKEQVESGKEASETGDAAQGAVPEKNQGSEQTGVGNAEAGASEEGDSDGKPKVEGDDAEAGAGQVAEAEQATYASANNDLKGTKLMNAADVAGLNFLAMAIVDYRGHRVVAQSIIPGILYGDKTASLMYGSVDNGKRIRHSADFHSKVVEAGKVLHLKEHEVEDLEGTKVKLCAPVEVKGIVGSDDRHYLLDLMRLTPRDCNFLEPTHRFYVLRPELVAAFCKVEEVEQYMALKGLTEQPSAEELQELREKEELPTIRFNVNVLTDFKLAGDNEEIEGDVSLVKKAGAYLVETAIPAMVKEFRSLDLSPMDGSTLTDAFHSRGVNMRYLGRVARCTEDLPHIRQLCLNEMVVRSTKHVLKAVLRETLDQDVGGAIAHFLNCFLGTTETPSIPPKTLIGGGYGDLPEPAATSSVPAEGAEKEGSSVPAAPGEGRPGYTRITADMVWSDISEGVKYKYQFELPEGIRLSVRHISTLRNACIKLGISIAAKDYDLSSDVPLGMDDIQDMAPVVKFTAPMVADAQALLDRGTRLMQEVGLPGDSRLFGAPHLPAWLRQHQGKLNAAFETLSEAFNLLQQICGHLHKDVASCCRRLAMVLYHAGEPGTAILQEHRELIINERTLGADHPEVAHSYANLALLYHALGEPELALRHMAHCLRLLSVTSGPNHPEIASTFINMSMMYQDAGNMQMSLRYLQEAQKSSERLLGEDHLQTATCHHAMALAFSAINAFKLSLQQEKKANSILERKVGKDDSRTRDSDHWMKTFAHRELQLQAQKQQGSQVGHNHANVMRIVNALQGRPDLLQALQQAGNNMEAVEKIMKEVQRSEAASASAGGRGSASGGTGGGRGAGAQHAPAGARMRGVDERAAKAAAEARRKAAARGVNLRGAAAANQGAARTAQTGQSSAPAAAGGSMDVDEIINLINANATKAPASSSASGTATGATSVGNAVPGLGAGLGVGLGALSGSAPPAKLNGTARKAAAAASVAPTANGGVPAGSGEKGPKGLGAGLDVPKKSKVKSKKGAVAGTAAAP